VKSVFVTYEITESKLTVATGGLAGPPNSPVAGCFMSIAWTGTYFVSLHLEVVDKYMRETSRHHGFHESGRS
jgi:hypothetical protein